MCAAQVIAGGGRLAQTRYVDPKGYFTIVPPDQWRLQEYPQDPRGKVAFSGPEPNFDLRVLVHAVDFSSMDDLIASLRDVERRMGVSTNITRVDFGGRPAVKRTIEFKGLKLYYIDFLVGQVKHNLAFTAPMSLYEAHLPLALKSMETYEPSLRSVSDREVLQHSVAKKKRLAQLMLDNGNPNLAATYVKEGLELSPKDPDLLKLREQIDARKSRR